MFISQPYGFNIGVSSPTSRPTVEVRGKTISKQTIIIIVAASVGSFAVITMIALGIRYRLKKLRKNNEKKAFNKWHTVYYKDSMGAGERRSELITRGNPLSNKRRKSTGARDVDDFFSSPQNDNEIDNSNSNEPVEFTDRTKRRGLIINTSSNSTAK